MNPTPPPHWTGGTWHSVDHVLSASGALLTMWTLGKKRWNMMRLWPFYLSGKRAIEGPVVGLWHGDSEDTCARRGRPLSSLTVNSATRQRPACRPSCRPVIERLCQTENVVIRGTRFEGMDTNLGTGEEEHSASNAAISGPSWTLMGWCSPLLPNAAASSSHLKPPHHTPAPRYDVTPKTHTHLTELHAPRDSTFQPCNPHYSQLVQLVLHWQNGHGVLLGMAEHPKLTFL